MVDPITVEIVQNRLVEIAREGGITLVRTAASPIVVHSKDLGFNISDPRGFTLVYSSWMPRHGTTLRYMLHSCLGEYGHSIEPDDMFVTNDPYSGALHVFDIAVIAPVHYRGELIAWTACATHHPDIGAKAPGLFYDATDCWQEGLIIPPLKLVEHGRLRDDFVRFLLRNVRLPELQVIDLKAQIAANNVAKARLIELAGRYGIQTLKACYDSIIEFSEKKTRERIGQLSDGQYEAEDFIDYDKLYRLACRLEVRGENLSFDFSGTDAQAPTFINSTLACSVANAHNIIICLLIPDIEANEGCFRPISIHIPEGSVLNCRPPAPCAGASVIGGKKAQALTLKALSQALLKSSLQWRATAPWASTHLDLSVEGKDRRGRWFFTTVRETSMLGGGARATKDGIDVSNIAGSTNTSVPNVEQTEERYPLLYLKRSLRADGEGAGEFRGGFGGDTVFKVHGAGQLTVRAFIIGSRVPDSGMEGGLEGAPTVVEIKKDTDVQERLQVGCWPDFSSLRRTSRVLEARNDPFELTEHDVLRISSSSGGGFGTPQKRDPKAVLQDMKECLVTQEKARQIYKVAVKNNGELDVDAEETAKLRATDPASIGGLDFAKQNKKSANEPVQ
jgi:N-methylhydantoinase B